MENFENLNSRDQYFILITGASGAGKTSILTLLKKLLPSFLISINFFDSIGIPSLEEMIKKYGSVEKWQETTVHKWIKRLTHITDKKLIFLEGQFNPEFAASQFRRLDIKRYLIICLHASRDVRENRLLELRKQPELINNDMENWAHFLKKKTIENHGIVIDNSHNNSACTAEKIMEAISML